MAPKRKEKKVTILISYDTEIKKKKKQLTSKDVKRVCVCVCSVVSNSLQPHGLQPARLLYPREFSRQEYWSGLPFPSPGDLPDSGIEPVSPVSIALAGRLSTTEPPGKPMCGLLSL